MIDNVVKHIDRLRPAVLIVALFGFAFRAFFGAPMLAMIDMPAFPIDGMSSLFMRYFVSAWQAQGLGRPIDFDYREVLYSGLAILLRDNGELTQKVFYLSLLPIGSLLMYALIRRLGVRSRFAAFVGAALYGFNPITFSQFAGAPGQLATIALLPLLVIGSLDVAEARPNRLRATLWIAISLALITSFNPYFPLIVAPLLFVFWLYGVASPCISRLKNLILATLCFVVGAGLAFLLTLPSTLPTLTLLLSSSQQASVNAFTGDTLPSLVGQIKLCYNASTPIELLRGTGNPCTLDSALGYSDVSWWSQIGLVLPILSFGALLSTGAGGQSKRYVGLFSLVALLAVALTWQIHLDSPLSIFRRFEFLFLFRNPVKITMFLPLGYAPLIAFSWEGLTGVARTRLAGVSPGGSYPSAFAAGILVIGSSGLIVYNWPALTGDMGFSRLFQNDYVVPPVYYEANAWMGQRRLQEGFFRTLWLPFDHSTQVRLSSDTAGVTAIDEESGTTDAADVGYVNYVLTALCSGNTRRLGALLAPANVGYVVVDLTSHQTGKCQIAGLDPLGSPNGYLDLMSQQQDLVQVARDQNWVVFKNSSVLPHIAVFDEANHVPALAVFASIAGENQGGLSQLLVFADSPGLEAGRGGMTDFQRPVGFSSPATSVPYEVRQESDTSYVIDLKTDHPVYLAFGESYHELWNAYYDDGTRLAHFPAFYFANGYRVDRTGEVKIKLIYDGQDARNKQILISAITWIVVFAGVIVSTLRGARTVPAGLKAA